MGLRFSNNRTRRAPRWVTWAIVAGTLLFLTPFYYFNRMDLAQPGLACAIAIGCAILTDWKLRTRRWFWPTIAVVAAIHAVAIFRGVWTYQWISVYFIGMVTLLDYGAILALMKLVEVTCRSPEEAETIRSKTIQ
jgi:hypothetical protein